jgi:hypothetical protein
MVDVGHEHAATVANAGSTAEFCSADAIAPHAVSGPTRCPVLPVRGCPGMGAPRSRDHQWWDQRRFGLLVHTSTAAVPAWAPIGQYAEWYRAHLDGTAKDVLLHPSPMVETIAHHHDRWAHVERFDDFTELLTFDAFDADEWAQLAVDAGMSYTVMVAKHHDGLCWWDAPRTDHTVVAAGPTPQRPRRVRRRRAGRGAGVRHLLLAARLVRTDVPLVRVRRRHRASARARPRRTVRLDDAVG